ncbi:MAG TPA: BrnT family toxin [Caulobacteraceae bacterium]
MGDDLFEWDAAKAEANYLKHGVDFPTAAEVFSDPFGIEEADPRSAGYGEDRFLLTGMGGGSLLTVVYTERGESLRIISARRATKHEHDNYFLQNSQE